MPEAITAAAAEVKSITDAGGEVFMGGLRGMVKTTEAALGDAIGTPVKDLKKQGKYHAEVY